MNEPEQMKEFEQQLQRTLRRVEAPPSMAAFLMQAAEDEESKTRQQARSRAAKMLMFPKPQAWFTGALAASVIGLCIFGGVQVHHEREQAQADRQFDAAVQATGHALYQTREQLRRAGVPALQ